MMEKKMNWGTLVIGIVIGLVVMWIIQAATKPAGGQVVNPDIPVKCTKTFTGNDLTIQLQSGQQFLVPAADLTDSACDAINAAGGQ